MTPRMRGVRFSRAAGIKYDGSWLCRGDVSFLDESFVPAVTLNKHIGGVAQMVRATDS